MRSIALTTAVLAALCGAAAGQSTWSDLVAARWPGDAIRKVSEKEFEAFLARHTGALGKAGAHDAFLRAQYAAHGLPLPRVARFLVPAGHAEPTAVAGETDALVREGPEPNGDPNTGGTPTPLRCGDQADGAIDVGGDADWYVFQLATRSEIEITTGPGLSGPGLPGALADSLIEVYDAAFNLLAVNDDYGGIQTTSARTRGNYSWLNLDLPAGGYFVNVRAFGATQTGNYTLDLQCKPRGRFFPESAEPNSPLDTPPGTPTLLPLLDSTSDGEVAFAGDTDYYRLVVGGAPVSLLIGTAEGGIGLVPNIGDSTLELLDSAGNSLATDDDGGPGAYSQIKVTLQPGAYDIDVRGFGSRTGGYRLYVWELPTPTGAVAEGPEPNGNPNNGETPTPFGCGLVGAGEITGGGGTAGDNDWWAFTLSSGTHFAAYTLPNTNGPTAAINDTFLHLHDVNGVEIAADDDNGRGLYSEIVRYLDAGTYYLRVRGFGGGDIGDYYLYLTCPGAVAFFSTLPGGCPGSSGNAPQMTARSLEAPVIGTTFTTDVVRARPNAAALAMFGFSNTITSTGQNLPFDLGLLGATGCRLEVDPLVNVGFPTSAFGAGTIALPIAYDPSIVSVQLYVQSWVLDPGANAAGIVTTNTGVIVIGDRL